MRERKRDDRSVHLGASLETCLGDMRQVRVRRSFCTNVTNGEEQCGSDNKNSRVMRSVKKIDLEHWRGCVTPDASYFIVDLLY